MEHYNIGEDGGPDGPDGGEATGPEDQLQQIFQMVDVDGSGEIDF